jgi:uncharacterized SAM-binding protein YcdF (DUF218 family)
LLAIFASGAGAGAIQSSLERRTGAVTPAAAPQAPVIVVLGGGLVNSNDPSGNTELGPHSERLWAAAELYRAGKAPLILISGASPFDTIHPPESDLAARILKAWGIPDAAILTENQSLDTHQNAVFTQRFLAARGISRILLVTSALHMPRAAATFRHTGLTVVPVPADYQNGPDTSPLILRLLPNAGALDSSGAAIKEWLGLAGYRMLGWSS